MRRPLQIEDRRSDGSKERALKTGGHETARPIRLPADRAASLIQDHDVAGQTLVLGAEPIRRPTAERRPTDKGLARIHRDQRRAMRVTVGMQRLDDREFVGMPSHVGEEVGDP